jgi:hypothetical protein
MRAAVHDRYGVPDVLRLEDVERAPPQGGRSTRQYPRHHGQPMRTSQPQAVRHWFAMQMLGTGGLLRPKRKILGSELAGAVEAVGEAVAEF